MASISKIEGIGKKYTKLLQNHGIRTVEKLLAEGGAKKGRKAIAAAIGVTETKMLEWVNRADLYRVKGVGEEFGDLLEAAGVDSPKELSKRKAANLAVTIKEYNDKKKIVRRVPSEASLQKMIDFAKGLDKVVYH